MTKSWSGFAAVVCAVLLGAGAAQAPARAQRPELAMLGALNDGRWELRLRSGGGLQRLCLGDRRRLVQLRHPDLPCSKVILDDGANSVTVQYACRGHGVGLTRIRRESARLIQIETQGIADGLPFDLSYEGRWVGECGV